MTKSAVRADRADYLPDLVRQAFALARSGKPGPVLIDIPRDLFEGEIEMPPYVPSPSGPGSPVRKRRGDRGGRRCWPARTGR